MMPAYNYFLLFKIDFAKGMEYRQQITCACGTGAGKTFRLKYVFPAGKIIRTAKCGDEINLTWNFGTTNLCKLA
jgi:hypothetical protein